MLVNAGQSLLVHREHSDVEGVIAVLKIASGRSCRHVISVLLVNDQPIVRAGLKAALDEAFDVKVTAAVDNPVAAVERIRSMVPLPDVVIYEVETCDDDVCTSVRTLAAGNRPPAVLLICGNCDGVTALRALIAGARSCLPTSADADTIAQNVRTIAGDSMVLPTAVGRDLVHRLRPQLDSHRRHTVSRLADRERAVLSLLACGRSNHEIANTLIVSEATVKKHLSHVMRKLGLHTRLEAGLFAYQVGLGPTGPVAVDDPGNRSPTLATNSRAH
jgi:DNA-binding NarL/FixJ family response regulator